MKKIVMMGLLLALFASCQKDPLDRYARQAVKELDSYRGDYRVNELVNSTTSVMRQLVSTDETRNKQAWDSLNILYKQQMLPYLKQLKQKMVANHKVKPGEILSTDSMVLKRRSRIHIRNQDVTIEEKDLTSEIAEDLVVGIHFYGIVDRDPEYIIGPMYLSYQTYYRWEINVQLGGTSIRDYFFDGVIAYGLYDYGGMEIGIDGIMTYADRYNASESSESEGMIYPYYGSGDVIDRWNRFLNFMESSRKDYLAIILMAIES